MSIFEALIVVPPDELRAIERSRDKFWLHHAEIAERRKRVDLERKAVRPRERVPVASIQSQCFGARHGRHLQEM